jgi:2,3-bisphosphoglycerate-independent phosphoglycerate mutase
MKYAIVILDGAAGEPLAVNGGLTSLQAARTPNLDALAAGADSLLGLARNTPEGMEPSSNIACTSICGYNPAEYPIGRGALEGAAIGIDLAADEVALRLNLCNISPEGVMVSYSTDNISTPDGNALAAELKAALDDGTFTLHAGAGFRCILVVKGHPELMDSTFTAAHNMTDENVGDYPGQGPAAALIKDYETRAAAVLATSPTNARRIAAGELPATNVLAFWPGQRAASMASFTDIYHKDAGLCSGVDLLHGIAKLAGITEYNAPGITDGPDNDYAAQAALALDILAEKDVAIIHVEAPDACGHDGDAAAKRGAIEAIDRDIISRLRAYAQDEATPQLRILALPDHPTPVATKRHAPDNVPFVLAGPGIKGNGEASQGKERRLTEADCAATGLVIDPGYQLMGILVG